MATADELLSTIDTDKTLIIDKDLRTIIIPSSVKNLGVESDDDVLRLKFSMPRMYGDVDLSDFSIYINYMNAKNTGDVYVVDDKTIADDTITFSWLVGRVALAYKGNVRFIVCMKKHDDNSNVIQEYNTTIASLPVLEGLETGETVIQQNPDIIEMLLTLSEPLVGTTQTITPSQVLAAIKEGRDIALQYTDSYYGVFVFSAFNANEKLGIVVSNSILPQWDGLTGTLIGFVDDAGWVFRATNTATKDDVGTAVNEALTAAKASGEFDGADGKSAYSYAVDGGYTGTEAEFAAKLAAEGLDKALYVVNLTMDFDTMTPSVDKTFEEIKQVYDEGKYSIVLSLMGMTATPLIALYPGSCIFAGVSPIHSDTATVTVDTIIITKDNVIQNYSDDLALKTDKLPNPYPLTFTGAVSETYDGSSAKTIEIPSGGAHSDWNQNDSTAADYIKNRPFYTGDPVETVLVEERTVPFTDNNHGLYIAQIQSNFAPTVGETYKVSWDGTAYECTCVDLGNLLIIGNLSLAGEGSDTGEPFLINIVNGAGIAIATADTSASHTFSISRFTQEVVKIDEKYLPDVLTTKMNNTNPTGSGSFSLNRKANTPIGANSFAEGWKTTASGEGSHAEGSETTASGRRSHAEGNVTTASGSYSHAEGYVTIASGEGSHAEGYSTIASSNHQHVQGKYNIEDSSGTYADIVGNGAPGRCSNAHTLDWEGNAWYSGTIEGKALILPSSTSGSTKKFKITVDDSGTITATEIGAAS